MLAQAAGIPPASGDARKRIEKSCAADLQPGIDLLDARGRNVLRDVGQDPHAGSACFRIGTAYLEAVSKIEGVALHPEIGDDKAPCAGNGGSISKYGNAVSADFRVQPFGPGPFLRTPALLIAHLARLNYALRALDCA